MELSRFLGSFVTDFVNLCPRRLQKRAARPVCVVFVVSIWMAVASNGFSIVSPPFISKHARSNVNTALSLFSIPIHNNRGNSSDAASNASWVMADPTSDAATATAPATSQEDENENEDLDFSQWIQGLSQWPLYPSSKHNEGDTTQSPGGSSSAASSSAPTQDSLPSALTSGRYRGTNPLVNLVQLLDLLTPDGQKDSGDGGATNLTTSSSNKNAMTENNEKNNTNSISIFKLADQLFKNFRQDATVAGFIPTTTTTTTPAKTRASPDATDSDGDESSAASTYQKTNSTTTATDAATPSVEELISQQSQRAWLEALQRSIASASIPFIAMPTSANTDTDGTDVNNDTTQTTEMAASSSSTMNAANSNTLEGSESIIATTNAANDVANTSNPADFILQDATSRMEFVVQEASTLAETSTKFLPQLMERMMEFISREEEEGEGELEKDQDEASYLSMEGTDAAFLNISNASTETETTLPRDDTRVVQETTRYATDFLTVANALYTAGFIRADDEVRFMTPASASATASGRASTTGNDGKDSTTTTVRPLFADFTSAQQIASQDITKAIHVGADMGQLAGAIYEATVEQCHDLGHSLVARGQTANVAWMVTDSVVDGGRMQRTITIRGFDASDDSVDRERLLNVICSPSPPQRLNENIVVHNGLWETAKAIAQDVEQYVDWMVPQSQPSLVLNGHSIGGSLSVMLMMYWALERGVDWVLNTIGRVYTHGSPPVAAIVSEWDSKATSFRKRGGGGGKSGKANRKRNGSIDDRSKSLHECPILEAMGLPSDLVYAYVQPYDPIIRFLTEFDPLYPLVDDLGGDERTLYANGPRRSLRPITRVILSSWAGWPEFRVNWKGTNSQYFQSVGIQHLYLPDAQRYLTDRFVSANIGVPPIDNVIRLSSNELLPALNAVFPLDTFQISLIPQAVRSRKILDNKASVQEKLSKLPSFSESMNLNMNMNTDKKNDDYSSNESGIFSSRILLNDEWLP